jgi:hypothetical protein
MRRSPVLLACLALSLPGLGGCQKLDEKRSVTLAPGDVKNLQIDAPRADQKVHVAVTSSDCPVDVYVVLQKDHDSVDQTLLAGNKPDAKKVLASQEKTRDASLEATVPAKSGYSIFFAGATKPTTVSVQVSGR